MLAAVLSVLAICQGLEQKPEVVMAGKPVQVWAVDAARQPMAGVRIYVVEPGGKPREIGTTTTDPGAVTFVPAAKGIHELRGQVPGRDLWLLRATNVAARPRRWLQAALLGPLGVLVLVYNFYVLKRIRRSRRHPRAS